MQQSAPLVRRLWRLGLAGKDLVPSRTKSAHAQCIGKILVAPQAGDHGEGALIAYKEDFLEEKTASDLFQAGPARLCSRFISVQVSHLDGFKTVLQASCGVGQGG